MLRFLANYTDVRRLLAGAVTVTALAIPLVLLAGKDDPRKGVMPAVLLATSPAADSAVNVGLEKGDLAPDFEVSTPDGERIRLSDLRGRAVLINFWARWCTSCLSEMPNIKAVQEEVGSDRLAVLAINAGESRKEALQFIDYLQAPFDWALDPDLVVADAYGVYGLPESVFIDAGGIIRAVYRGHASRDLFASFVQAAVDAATAGDPAPTIRLITTVPRERAVEVRYPGPGKVQFVSRSLRCDATYCAAGAAEALRGLPGVRSVAAGFAGGKPSMTVEFDRAVTDAASIREALLADLQRRSDPLYTGPITVKTPS
jgi:peroxiredoxin/copper chaperone CopZ